MQVKVETTKDGQDITETYTVTVPKSSDNPRMDALEAAEAFAEKDLTACGCGAHLAPEFFEDGDTVEVSHTFNVYGCDCGEPVVPMLPKK